MGDERTWECKIGFADFSRLPPGSDGPMRQAVKQAFMELTGHEPLFIFSGWGGTLTDDERECVDFYRAYNTPTPQQDPSNAR